MASDAQELSPGGGRAGAPGGVPGADYRFSVERVILLDTHTGLRLDCLLRVSWRNPWLPPPNAGALLRAEDDRGNEYPQFQNRPFLTGRYLHGGPLPGAPPSLCATMSSLSARSI